MRVVVMNSTSVVPNTNNSKYRFKFASTTKFHKDQIALSNISIYYSWYNVTTRNNNTTYEYIWNGTSGPTTYTVTMPDGTYEVADMNAYLQKQFIANGHYLVDDLGRYVYYATLTINAIFYSIEIKAYPLPATLPTGWSNPAGLVLGSTDTPQIVIPTTNIRTLLGFNAGTYPPTVQSTTYNVLSQNTPQIATVQSIIVLCNLLNNTLTNPNTFLYSFGSDDVGFGRLISIQVPQLIFTDITDGIYDFFEVTLVDQNYQPISIIDNNIIMQFVIKKSDAFELEQALRD
jgi:hypothetical protein